MRTKLVDGVSVPLTDAENAARVAEEAQAAIDAAAKAAQDALEASKLTGIEILGVMCSATKNDQNGLTAVAMGVTLARGAGQTFPDTVFEFDNGNQITVTDSNFNTIYAAWTPFRQSFFSVPA